MLDYHRVCQTMHLYFMIPANHVKLRRPIKILNSKTFQGQVIHDWTQSRKQSEFVLCDFTLSKCQC